MKLDCPIKTKQPACCTVYSKSPKKTILCRIILPLCIWLDHGTQQNQYTWGSIYNSVYIYNYIYILYIWTLRIHIKYVHVKCVDVSYIYIHNMGNEFGHLGRLPVLIIVYSDVVVTSLRIILIRRAGPHKDRHAFSRMFGRWYAPNHFTWFPSSQLFSIFLGGAKLSIIFASVCPPKHLCVRVKFRGTFLLIHAMWMEINNP